MAGKKILTQSSGRLAEYAAVQSSAGAANAGDVPALDATGRLDPSMMPVGLGADTASIVASEALAAGNLVNIWNNAGTPNIRKADASVVGKEAHGFVLAAVAASASATVYMAGQNTQMTGLTGGLQYLSTTPGTCSATPPTGSGNVVQQVGAAVSATTLNFVQGDQIVLA